HDYFTKLKILDGRNLCRLKRLQRLSETKHQFYLFGQLESVSDLPSRSGHNSASSSLTTSSFFSSFSSSSGSLSSGKFSPLESPGSTSFSPVSEEKIYEL